MTALCPACTENGSCISSCSNQPIVASNNAPGVLITRYVQTPQIDLPPGVRRITDLNFSYLPANDDRHPTIARTKANVARLEGVDTGDVVLTGSILDLIAELQRALGCETVVKLEGDFFGYTRAVDPRNLIEVRTDRTSLDIPAGLLAAAVAKAPRPLVYMTFPMTNPFQQRVGVAVVTAVLEANKDAIVVVDNAYRRWGDTPGLAKLARDNDRIVYVQTAAKDLLLCGGRGGWVIAGPALREKIASRIAPYVLSPVSVSQMNSLLEAPATIEAMIGVVAEARDILTRGVSELGVPTRVGAGPWVLLDFAEKADDVVFELATNYGIQVQLQAGALKGWVRVSATVPCEADRIVRALAEIISLDAMLSRLSSPLKRLVEKIARQTLSIELEKLLNKGWTPLIAGAQISPKAVRPDNNVIEYRNKQDENDDQ
jgi:histidinol-phosphate/aromatic aminotransferase/cobyric acid decarboxylase-like protein